MTTVSRLMTNEYTNPAGPSAFHEIKHAFPPPFRTLEMAGVLQTTLDLSELMDLFLSEMQGHVEMDGLRYRQGDQGLEIMKGELSRHSVSYSLTVRGQRLGEIAFFRAVAFQSSEIRTLEDLLAALLYPLRNSLDYQHALQAALIDPLTGVNNRSAMEVVLKRELELARRCGTPLAVILLDVDFFKQINDTYGHPIGDLCLQALAHCVQESVRGSDMVFRVGGEEFLVLLSPSNREGAEQLAERVRCHVQGLTLGTMTECRLSVSLGVTEVTAEDTIASLYQRADRAMYQAKQRGRNRVEAL